MDVDRIIQGDALDVLRGLPDACVDAVVTDPPAGIAFMGKDWDAFRRRHNPADVGRENVFGRTSRTSSHSYGESDRGYFIETMTAIFAEALRVVKPGGHALVWALPRTSHWTAMALEDAGWEIRDRVSHLFGQGFPKSLDVSKQIDRMAGAERAVVGRDARPAYDSAYARWDKPYEKRSKHFGQGEWDITAAATDDAKTWQGWGTALKPAVEDWWLCRKPLSEPTVAANVLRWGVGALNINATRIQSQEPPKAWAAPRGGIWRTDSDASAALLDNIAGRWPAHLVLDEEAAALLDAQSGTSSGARPDMTRHNRVGAGAHGIYREYDAVETPRYGDSGGCSRFFYVAKASRSERNAGCEALPLSRWNDGRKQEGKDYPSHLGATDRGNHHPTVKPIALMRWLVRLITPPGGTVLDFFAGSGSTLVACIEEGAHWLGIERESEYIAIAEARVAHAAKVPLVATPRVPAQLTARKTRRESHEAKQANLWDDVAA